MKVDVMLTGSVNYQGKEMSMRDYLQMQDKGPKNMRQTAQFGGDEAQDKAEK
jgi:hypothetical protein